MKYHQPEKTLWNITDPFFPHLCFLLKNLLNHHFLQLVMIIWSYFYHKLILRSKRNYLLSICILRTTHFVSLIKIKIFSHRSVHKLWLHTNTGLTMVLKISLSLLTTTHTVNFYHTQNHKTIFCQLRIYFTIHYATLIYNRSLSHNWLSS